MFYILSLYSDGCHNKTGKEFLPPKREGCFGKRALMKELGVCGCRDPLIIPKAQVLNLNACRANQGP